MEKVVYGYTTSLGKIDFNTAIDRVTEALKSQGFGVLTEIDVSIANPMEMFKVVDNQELQGLAGKVDGKLRAVLDTLNAG